MAETWTDATLTRLKELCLLPLSNSLIAQQLSNEFHIVVTRNSVIGKRQRTGLTFPRPPHSPRPKPQRLRRRGTLQFRSRKIREPRLRPEPMSPLPTPTVFPHACDLMALKNESCRYPCDTPLGELYRGHTEQFFCGTPEANLAVNRPYCAAHAWITRGHV